MIRSMTGYGRGEYKADGRHFVCEMKSVNHRYHDVTIKMPRFMNSCEDKIRKMIAKEVFRGKIDVYISFDTVSLEDHTVVLNEALAAEYVERLNWMKDKFSVHSPDMLGLLAKFPDVLCVERPENSGEELWSYLETALSEALENFIAMRETEGKALYEDIMKKAETIRTLTDSIKVRAPFVAVEYRQKLMGRLSELLDSAALDEGRVAAEVTIFADRSCIDEELTRLSSHIAQLGTILLEGGQVGRKLDFLVQEMNRETNTIASKANDLEITRATIDLKSEIEKIREQIQNIE